MTICEWCGVTFEPTNLRGPKPRFCRKKHGDMASERTVRVRAQAAAPARLFPAAPLVRAARLAGFSWKSACAAAGLVALKNDRLTADSVDRIVTKALGSHPILIYGDDWLDPVAYQEGLDEVA